MKYILKIIQLFYFIMVLYNYYFKIDAVLIFLLPTAYTVATSKYQQGIEGAKKKKRKRKKNTNPTSSAHRRIQMA